MRTPLGGLRPALMLIAALAAEIALAAAGPTSAANRHDVLPLHSGSAGPRVAALQWEMHVPRPKQNVFKQIHGTFKWKPNGELGARTKHSLEAYRWRLGYPQKGQCGSKSNQASTPTAGAFFFKLLEGKATRPACWVALAAKRVKAVTPTTNPSPLGAEWASILGDWLGIAETSDNRGPCISTSCIWRGVEYPAIQASTGAYGAAWCVSTEQAVAHLLGLPYFAGDTANVYAAVDAAAAANGLYAKPKLYSLVAFVTYGTPGAPGVDSKGRVIGTGHMGFVTAVYANSFTYRAGNDGNAVREHTIPDGSRSYVFLYVPKVTTN